MSEQAKPTSQEQPETSPRPPRKRGSTRTKQCSTNPGAIRRKALSRKIFRLRVKGYTVRAIARKLVAAGYKTSESDVHRILKTELDALGASRETKEQARDISLARIESLMPSTLRRGRQGDDKAIASFTKLDERAARYLGTEAPQEHGVKLTVLGQVNWILDIITEELGADATERVLRRISAESGPPAPQGDGGGPPGEHEPIPGRDA